MSIQQIIAILWKRSWMIALALVSTMVGTMGFLLIASPRYDASTTASVDAGQLDPVTGQGAGGGNMLSVLQGNLVALAASQRVATEVVKRLNLARDPQFTSAYARSGASDRVSIEEWIASDYLMKNVGAGFRMGSNILTITYKTNSATQSALMANTFMSAFLDAAVELKTSAATQTASWFVPQMDKMQAELKAASDKLAQFQRESKLLALSNGPDTETTQLAAISTELATAKGQLLLLQSQTTATEQNAKNKNSKDKQANDPNAAQRNLALLPDSPTLTAIKGNLANVVAEIGKLQAEVGENNPKMINLRATRRSLEDQIRTEVASRHKALREQIQFLEEARQAQQQKMIATQTERDQLMSLQREVQTRQSQIDSATKAAGDARLQSRLSFLNIAVLDSATPPGSPAFPKTAIIIPLGIGAGLALGVIFALLAEALDRRVRVMSDLEFAASAPVLGTLISLAPPRRLLSHLRLGKDPGPVKGALPAPRAVAGRDNSRELARTRPGRARGAR